MIFCELPFSSYAEIYPVLQICALCIGLKTNIDRNDENEGPESSCD
ncbi:MAG: hypothetical protein C5S48_09640 [Candidatus Methanogaster sp.]|nr:MAG: hypothetical protein C5S48_09640 [ANME-2 cluster archaeon]